jgi:hypothetical protein
MAAETNRLNKSLSPFFLFEIPVDGQCREHENQSCPGMKRPFVQRIEDKEERAGDKDERDDCWLSYHASDDRISVVKVCSLQSGRKNQIRINPGVELTYMII